MNVRYLSVGIPEDAALDVIKTLLDLDSSETICAYPILAPNEIEACRKTRFNTAKDARHSFNTIFGISSKYVNRTDTKKSPEMQMRGNLQDALGAAKLRFLTYAQSLDLTQPISMSSSEDLCYQKCIFKISSDAVKQIEICVRECDEVQNNVIQITALKSALVSAKTIAFHSIITDCVNSVNSRVNDSERIKSIECILKSVPIEFSYAPNGLPVRISRPLKCPEIRLTTTGVFRLVILIFYIAYIQYFPVARLTFVSYILEPMEIGILFIDALKLWSEKVSCWMLTYPTKLVKGSALPVQQRLSDNTIEDSLAERDQSDATNEVLCVFIPDLPYTTHYRNHAIHLRCTAQAVYTAITTCTSYCYHHMHLVLLSPHAPRTAINT